MACGGYNIEYPQKDAVYTELLQRFVVTYQKAPNILPSMLLNGFEVKNEFTKGDKSATASGQDLKEYLGIVEK